MRDTLIILGKGGQPIRSFEEWARLAPPKEPKKHWVEGRSALEMARAWVGPDGPRVPAEIAAAFSSHPDTREIRLRKAWVELETKLDEFRGEGRNHDLLAVGDVPGGQVVVGVEGKADEPFGEPIGKYRRLAVAKNSRSNVPARIDGLLNALLGRPYDDDIQGLRYQLLHASAGTLIEADCHSATRAVLLVQEFATIKTDPAKRASNHSDLNRFASLLAARPVAIAPGTIAGPFKVPGGGKVPGNVLFYVGLALVSNRANTVPR